MFTLKKVLFTGRILAHSSRKFTSKSVFSSNVHAFRNLTAKIPNKKPLFLTPKEAVDCISSEDTLYVHAAAATPFTLLHAIKDHCLSKNLHNVRAYHMHLEGEPILTSPDSKGHIRSFSVFTGANCRNAIAEGYADFIPVFLHQVPKLLRECNIPLNYAIVQMSQPDEHGYCSLGSSVDCVMAACQKADFIIAYLNKQMPRTFGDGIVHISQIDRAVMADEPIYCSELKPISAEETKIGGHIANNLVEDGATLQIGIGAIPTAVMTQIRHQKNLGIHTEMVADPIIDLIESGVVNNSQKVLHPGKTVSSFSIGSERLYKFMNNNPAFLMLDCAYTNDPSIIRQNPKVTAINSCIEIDLTGQIVSDSIGSRIYSGVGGQVDFIFGASSSLDGLGKAIIAFVSATKKGVSKIVPFVKQGSGVTTSRNHVQYVVTENGIACLFGKSSRERAYELIKIAHPDHQESLDKAAFDLFKSRPPFDSIQ